MIRLVTDSASMLPHELSHRYGIVVVPMTVTVDGIEYEEGRGLATEEFYARLEQGASVSTSAPSPGALLEAYRSAADAGADQVLSIHTGAAYSATVASATVAAEQSPIPVTTLDTGLGSFPVALCVWAAAECIAGGGSVLEARQSADRTAQHAGSVFVVGVPELARRGGRFTAVNGELSTTSILELEAAALRELTTVDDIEAAIDVMVQRTSELAAQSNLRVGVGDARRANLADQLASRLAEVPGVAEITRYEVGPSVGAHTGEGTVGVVYAPVVSGT